MDNMENKDLQNNEEVAPEVVEEVAAEEVIDEIPHVEAEKVSKNDKKPNKALEIISLVCGILSIIFVCCCPYVSPVFAIAAIVLALVAPKNEKGKLSGMALAGLIMGIIMIIGSVVTIILSLAGGLAGGILGSLGEMMNTQGSALYY